MASSASIDTSGKATRKPSKIRAILEGSSKGKAKESFFKGLTYMGISVLGGGLAAAVIGKPSFLIGAGLTFYGYYKDNHWLAPLGLGMMASSHLVPNESVEGVSGFSLKQETQNAKDRLSSFKDSLLSKTYIDKVIKPKKATENKKSGSSITTESTNGFGSVQENQNVLDQIEQQLIASAMEIQKQGKIQSTQGVGRSPEDFDEEDYSRF